MLSINNLSPFAFWYIIFFVAVIGLCIGSFSNVLILRGLSGESVVLPPSKCPKCHNKLKWYDNIPLLSYLFLGGKCRFCKEHISFQYPIIELLMAILYVFVILKFDFSLTSLFMLAILPLFVVMSVTDLKEQVILTQHSYGLAVLGTIYNFVVNKDFLLPIYGIIAGFLSMEILARLIQLVVGKRAFGEGDSYIGAAIGAIIGWKLFLSSLALAVVLQTIIILPQFFYKLYKNKQFLLLGSIISFASVACILTFVPSIKYVLYVILALLLLVLGVIIILLIFNYRKENELQTVPFGPAMLISAFLFIFFKNYLSIFIF